MCKRVRSNLRPSFSKLETLLAWFAIFIWLVFYTQSFTELDGFINIVQRLTSGDWLNWKPIVGGVWYMFVASGAYWAGLALVAVVFILLLRKIIAKHKEDEPMERIEKTLANICNDIRGMKTSIDSLASEIRLERESRNINKK